MFPRLFSSRSFPSLDPVPRVSHSACSRLTFRESSHKARTKAFSLSLSLSPVFFSLIFVRVLSWTRPKLADRGIVFISSSRGPSSFRTAFLGRRREDTRERIAFAILTT